MTYIFLAAMVMISLLIIFGFIKLENMGTNGRIINAEWLDDAEKFRIISRWGA